MNEIDAWLACDDDGTQWIVSGEQPIFTHGKAHAGLCGDVLCETHGHAIKPGECRPVKLRVEVVE